MSDFIGTATYDPADNKIRIYPFARLPRDVYDRVHKAGFIWAPKQELFVAPKWTPEREDLAEELCGDIGDEDKSLVERADERADRFGEYSEKRAADAERAHAGVAAIADNIPMGQPILCGHHSERHARKDAKRIQNGMRKAIKMWETSTYWTERASGAIRHAKYKELPAVRARRIKTLEAELRSMIASYTPRPGVPPIMQHRWNAKAEDPQVKHVWCGPAGRGGRWVPEEDLTAHEAGYRRWREHYENRLAYERAMLAESGYTPPPKKPSKADLPILNYAGTVSVRNQYRGDTETYEAAGITKAELAKIPTDYKGTRVSADGTHRVRIALNAFIPSLRGTFAGDDNKRHGSTVVYLTDSKQHPLPTAETVEATAAKEEADAVATLEAKQAARAARPTKPVDPRKEKLAALKDAVKAGVTVVAAPQLFPTPRELARRMVELAQLEPGLCVLEPSAGTGVLCEEVIKSVDTEVLAYEINPQLCSHMRSRFGEGMAHANMANREAEGWIGSVKTICKDFLAVTDFQGCYPRILMNPPFKDAADVKHILHALTFLAPGGRLVAVCANGPRQQEALKPIADEWIDLPDGTFAEQGTNVRTALVVITKGANDATGHVAA